MHQLSIPAKIKVGFQKRKDTYTDRLGYVVYYDAKGKLRKQTSWEGWRHKDIDPADFDNAPTDGFVLNRSVGGVRNYNWNARKGKVRVYDPRDFEFEISIPNLLFILAECDCSRGKGLEGKFVYSWQGKELFLLPVSSQDYKNSVEYTELQTQNVKLKSLINGATYITKKQEKLIYLGNLDVHFLSRNYWWKNQGPSPMKKYVFQNEKGNFVLMEDIKALAKVISEAVVPDYAERIEKYRKSRYGSKVVDLFLKEVKRNTGAPYYDLWAREESPGVFAQCTTQRDYPDQTKIRGTYVNYLVKMKDGVPVWESCHKISIHPDILKTNPGWRNDIAPFMEPTQLRLFAKLESGGSHELSQNDFSSNEPEEDEDGEGD